MQGWIAHRAQAVVSMFCLLSCTGCGLYVPEKDLLAEDQSPPPPHTKVMSDRGDYERKMIDHIQCEIAQGLVAAQERFGLPWLDRWGTAVTLTVSAQEQGGFNPSLSFGSPLANKVNVFKRGGNVTSGQNYSTVFGIGFSDSALRSETIQFTYRNSDILKYYKGNFSCDYYRDGIQMDSDLKIRQFIFDKAAIAYNGTANLAQPPNQHWALYNTFTEELSFSSAYSANTNPVLKLSTFGVDPAGTVLAAARSYSNDLIITIAKLGQTSPGPFSPVELGTAGQVQHNTKVQANAISTSAKQP